MYYIDTAERAVDAFDFDNVAGKVSFWQTCRDGSLAMATDAALATLDHCWSRWGIRLLSWEAFRWPRGITSVPLAMSIC